MFSGRTEPFRALEKLRTNNGSSRANAVTLPCRGSLPIRDRTSRRMPPQNNPQWQVWARRAGGWELLSPNFAGRKDLLAPGWLMEVSGESLGTKEPDMAWALARSL